MKKRKREFNLCPLNEIVEYFKDEPFLKIRITNYSTKVETETETYFFSEDKPDKNVFSFFNKMKTDIAGEYRNFKRYYKYFDFSGIKRAKKDFYAVDINSAYLTVLKNEGLISENTYKHIFRATNGKNKDSRLKAVGMFAKNPIEIFYHRGKVFSIVSKKDPFEWVFFLAVQKTFEAMEAVKKEIGKDFLFYWVDGIFTNGDPEKIIGILKKYGFNSKIERIENFHYEKGFCSYLKDGKEKCLFLPKNQREEKSEFLKNQKIKEL